ncbi:transmembrane protein 135-like isoform X2 [Amphiura filiformis]|uniref:transmembrane protein 135-like isoform X2 n=1 Tax=Amphiura filiformis TaxID=82378 RepID=UPI003B21206A
MAAPSKLWRACSCYELGHTWTPFCTQATLDVAKAAYKYSFRIYLVFYLVSKLVRHRGRLRLTMRFGEDLLRSTQFLASNAMFFMAGICLVRKVFGGFNYTFAFTAGAIASGLAILMERKSRRGVLALYMSNLGVETIFKMLAARGIVRPIPNGEVLLFSITSAIGLYLMKYGNTVKGDTQSALKTLFGPGELPLLEQDQSTQQEAPSRGSNGEAATPPSRSSNPLAILKQKVLEFVQRVRALQKHHLCLHKYSCTYYIIIDGLVRKFLAGFLIQAVINVVKGLKRIVKQPSFILKALNHKDNWNLGFHLSLYVGVFRGLMCLLRWLRNKDSPIHALVAGFVSGLSSAFYKSSTIALYFASKITENVFFKGQELGYIPHIPFGDCILYTLSTATVLHAAVFEPQNIRPAYWNFLLGLTGHNFEGINRHLLTPLVPHAADLYKDFWPNYDPKYLTVLHPQGFPWRESGI